MTQHHQLFRSLVFARSERSAELGLSAENLKEIRGDCPATHLLRLVAARKVVASPPPSHYAVKHPVLLPPIAKVGDGDRALIDPARLLRRPHVYEATRIPVR